MIRREALEASPVAGTPEGAGVGVAVAAAAVVVVVVSSDAAVVVVSSTSLDTPSTLVEGAVVASVSEGAAVVSTVVSVVAAVVSEGSVGAGRTAELSVVTEIVVDTDAGSSKRISTVWSPSERLLR